MSINSVNTTLQPSTSSDKTRSWIVVFSASLFFFYEFLQLNMFNAINPSLIKEFHVDAMQLGQLSAYYFYANIIFLFPAGMILDRFSTRKIILGALLISVISTFIFGMTSDFNVAKICRFITGVGGSFCFLSCVRLASRWFAPRQMALVIGLIVTFAMMGGVVAQTPFTWLADNFGWRQTLMIDAGCGVLFLILIFLLVQDFPPNANQESVKQHTHLSDLGFWTSLRQTLTNTQNWLGGIYTSLLNLPIFLIGGMWGSMYLVQADHLTRIQSSVVTSMIFFGTIIGSPILGWLSDRIGLRRMPMIICAIFSLAVILIITYITGLSFYSLVFLVLLLGFFTSAQIISYPLIAESNPLALTGTAEGLASVLIMAGGVSQPFFGWLMDLHWQHTLINQIPVYSIKNYQLAMSIMPIAFVIGLIAACLIRETYCRAQDNRR